MRLDPFLVHAEATGIRATERHWSLMPPVLSCRVRPRVARIGDGLATLMERSDSLRMNRVIGIGRRGSMERSVIDEIIEFYRAARLKRFSVLLGSGPQVAEISRWLLERGFTRHGGYALLRRDCREPIQHVANGVRVARARRKDLGAVVSVFSETFAVPESRRGWSAASIADSRHEHFLGFVGASPVAAGTLRVDRDLACLAGGATLTRWRGRGAHGALIVARLRRAARLGCRWAWCETTAPASGRPDGSRRNMLRLGFEELHVKPIFLWREE